MDVDGCDQTLVVDLQRIVVPDPLELEHRLTEVVPAQRPVVRLVLPDAWKAVASADGRLRLVLPEGSVSAPGQLAVEERPDLRPTLPPGTSVLSGPYTASCSAGDVLRAPAAIRFSLPDHEAPDSEAVTVLGRYAGGDWSEIPSAVTRRPFVVSSKVERLGTWMLQQRADQSTKE